MQDASRTGILLVNLGTPDAPTFWSVRRYLAEFLGDPLVIDTPRLIWLPILHGIILNLRPWKTAANYRRVWSDRGSPLLANSQDQQAALQALLRDESRIQIPVVLGMRYGQPSLDDALAELRKMQIERLLVLPLYPQFSHTTATTTFKRIDEILHRQQFPPAVRQIADYHDHPAYIAALAASIDEHWQTAGRSEHLLLSFHGLPKRYITNGDPYEEQCEITAALLVDELGLTDKDWTLSYQSRVGREEWLTPYTFATLQSLAQQGNRSVDVACPGFSADCLETLEEIALTNAEIYRKAGGGSLIYIPALNARPDHIRCMAQLVREHARDWLEQD
ncbi:MAG: ferrochelatase [Proteobacteria bacterium]|nr:ferrochelatase [Pseudomonadota bacterium]